MGWHYGYGFLTAIRALALPDTQSVMNAMRQCHAGRVLAVLTSLVGTGLLTGCLHSGTTGAKPVASKITIPSVIAAPATTSAASSLPIFLAMGAMDRLKEASGVHIEMTSVTSGVTTSVTDDATSTGGRQRFEAEGATATILFTGNLAYVEGNEAGLVGFFGVPDAKARSTAFRWISVRPGDTVGKTTYSDLTSGITAPAVAGELGMAAPYTRIAPATVRGQPAAGVRAHLPDSEKLPSSARVTLYVSKAGGRPVMYKLSGDGKHTFKATFSNWGEAVDLAAPANPVAASAL